MEKQWSPFILEAGKNRLPKERGKKKPRENKKIPTKHKTKQPFSAPGYQQERKKIFISS
jgi:hypothetical protein